MALTDKLTNIANAIREKGGTTEKLTLDAMPNAIAALSTGGDDGMPETIKITYGGYKFMGDDLIWLRKNYADRIVTNLESSNEYMFALATNDEDSIGFKLHMRGSNISTEHMFFNANFYPKEEEIADLRFLNVKGMYRNNRSLGKIPSMTFINNHSMLSKYDYLFSGCHATEIGELINFYPTQSFQYFFEKMFNLRHCPVFTNPDLSKLRGSAYKYFSGLALNCYSLRDIDANLLAEYYTDKVTGASYHPFQKMFKNCACIDEVNGIVPITATLKSNVFTEAFQYTYRLKNLTFALQEDGTPYTVNWKNQTIDLSQYTGWAGYSSAVKEITGYNSGITADKEATNKTTYDALKDDPDWWSREFIFSRFNHDSAVAMINSLPDTSAYITANGGTNTIKFYTNAGYYTDGGSVSQLTEEEVAVATAKGWTITYGV